jgi:hypothetical protein
MHAIAINAKIVSLFIYNIILVDLFLAEHSDNNPDDQTPRSQIGNGKGDGEPEGSLLDE